LNVGLAIGEISSRHYPVLGRLYHQSGVSKSALSTRKAVA
jgi:hypothetical protein